QDPNSIFWFYQKLIALRKQEQVLTDGKYELLLPEDEAVFAYTRTNPNTELLVLCNFTGQEQMCSLLKEWGDGEFLLGNYPENSPAEMLRPYETCMIIRRNKE
ncbi:MAG: alpha-glucosidase C-terminal domain-containing protein, partial [Blautia sp.]|nr:alpha-glucosidase C-terminal domain-containing protein [Blautia sp.]